MWLQKGIRRVNLRTLDSRDSNLVNAGCKIFP
ncbi:MAG: hypothetical protein TECD_01018 [Hyphomicrobiaceae bacterium hypho_1]